jgi:hypothetical protein
LRARRSALEAGTRHESQAAAPETHAPCGTSPRFAAVVCVWQLGSSTLPAGVCAGSNVDPGLSSVARPPHVPRTKSPPGHRIEETIAGNSAKRDAVA